MGRQLSIMLGRSEISRKLLEVVLRLAGQLAVSFGGPVEATKPIVRQQIVALAFSRFLPEGSGPENGYPAEVAGQWDAGRRDAPKEGKR